MRLPFSSSQPSLIVQSATNHAGVVLDPSLASSLTQTHSIAIDSLHKIWVKAAEGAATAFSILLFTESWMPSGFFLSGGPQRQVFIAGVEVKATLHALSSVNM